MKECDKKYAKLQRIESAYTPSVLREKIDEL